jgi:hypothetical protein
MSDQQSTCFTCGRAVGSPPHLNRLESGLACPTCRDRVLDFLPPILPGPGSLAASEIEDESVGASSQRGQASGLRAMSPIYPINPDEPA